MAVLAVQALKDYAHGDAFREEFEFKSFSQVSPRRGVKGKDVGVCIVDWVCGWWIGCEMFYRLFVYIQNLILIIIKEGME